MTDILALDIATVTGWARGRVGEEPRCGSIRFSTKGASQLAICGRALDWMIQTLKPPLPDVVAIEGLLPPHTIKKQSNVDHDLLAQLHGIVLGVCFMRGIYKVNRHALPSIRAHFINGPCAKGQAKRMVIERCRWLGWLEAADDDAADALAVWSYQAALIDPEQTIRISPLFRKNFLTKKLGLAADTKA